MSIWDRLLYLIGLRPTPGPRTYHFDASESLQVTLSTLSSDEGRPEHDLIPDILAAGLTQYTANERLWNTWESLSLNAKRMSPRWCVWVIPTARSGQDCISRVKRSRIVWKQRFENSKYTSGMICAFLCPAGILASGIASNRGLPRVHPLNLVPPFSPHLIPRWGLLFNSERY